MKSEIKNILLSLTTVIVLFWGIDLGIGYFGNSLLRRLPASATGFSKINFSIRHADPDLLIVGTSRANHHYNTRILSDSLKCKVYNAGLDGHGLTYASCIIESVIERCVPKLIVWEVNYSEDGAWNDKVNTLKPYFSKNKHVNDIIRRVNTYEEPYKCMFASYRFNSLFPRFVNAFISHTDTLAGYLPLQDNGKGKSFGLRKDTVNYTHADSCAISIFRKTADHLKQRGIPLVVIISPDLRYHTGPTSLKEVCQSMNIPFFDNSALPYFTGHPEMFNDPSHMNSMGAEAYTQFFLRQLRDSIWKRQNF